MVTIVSKMMAMYLVFAVTLVVAGALDDDSQVSIQSQSGRIIDIKASVQKGAKLLGGAEVESNEACVQECMGSGTHCVIRAMN